LENVLNDEEFKHIFKGKQTFDVIDVPPLEMARQLTLIDHHLISLIPPTELLNKRFTIDELSPNMTRISNHFNKITLWVSTEIVTTPNLKQRRKTLTYFINLAAKLLSLRNYIGLMSVFAGLTQFTVTRLRLTWKGLSEKLNAKWNKLETICSPISNFKTLRLLHDTNTTPIVKTPTLFLKDLTYIEEQDNFHGDDPNLLSVTKIRLLGKLIERIQTSQTSKYQFNQVSEIYETLTNLYHISLEQQEYISKKT